ncbi:MAG: SprT family zinc-dependent metalloprotease [Leptospira sp.]|nr:SprT family zinc-dependent metalloprotease [Leptospira sp.]
MNKILKYPDLGYECEIKLSTGKNVTLSVYPNNRIVIRSPKRVSLNFINEFLLERKSWVQKQYLKNKRENPQKTKFNEGEILPIFGANRTVTFSLTEANQITPDKFILNIRSLRTENGRKKRALSFLKSELIKQAVPTIEHGTKKIGTKKYSLKIKSMKSLWGSCSPKNQITLNLALVFCPIFVIHYVILHEVAHTIELNHSKNFWKLLETLDPKFKNAEKWIKESGKKVLCFLF